MGITCIWLGRYEKSEKILLKSLERTKKIHGDIHPAVGVVINNLGIMYHQKGDAVMALKYFQEGLRIKQETRAPHQSTVLSQANVALEYITLNKIHEANELLNDAQSLIQKENIKEANTVSYVTTTVGKMYLKVSNFDKAEEMFTKALVIRAEKCPGQYTHVQSLVQLMEVALEKSQYGKCIDLGKTVQIFWKNVVTQRPKQPHFLECNEFLKRACAYLGDRDGERHANENILNELSRLCDVYRAERNEAKVKELLAKIRTIKSNLV